MSMNNLTGQVLGQYELRELLGAGGMGAVYRGYQTALKRYVAIKVMSPELAQQPGYIERFSREAETAAALDHPNIVQIYDYGTQQGTSYLVMHLLTGGTLADRANQRVESGAPLPSLGEVSGLLAQLASALDYAHSQGVIHRDIKPANVMFDNHGNAYLVDFGIAKLAEATQGFTATGKIVGTWGYMAPEQWRADELTAATDQYALGVMIYALVTGQMPFEAATPAHVMHRHLSEMPTPPHAVLGSVPDSVTPVLERALAKKPGERFPTCTAFAQTFDGAIRGQTGETTSFFTMLVRRKPASASSGSFTPPKSASASQPSGPMTAERPIYKRPLVWLGAAMMVALIMVAILLLGGGDSEGDTPTEAAQVSANVTPSPEVTSVPVVELLATETPTLTGTPLNSPTPDDEGTIQAEMVLLQTERAQTEAAALTATATLWTRTPTPDLKGTAAALLTQTQMALDAQSTQTAYVTLTQAARDQTATATLWTDTPTATYTLTPTNTPTVTPTPDPLQVAQNFTGSNDDWTPVIREFDGVERVLVPAGCFEMGSNDGENDEQPVHRVCFDEPFWIDRYEVTNAQYRACVQAGACTVPSNVEYYGNSAYDDHPVVYVNWEQSRDYAEWRGCSLPSEAQWEYAARGPDGLVYPWGNTFSANNVVYKENSNGRLAAVGSKPGGASWVGALDLSGNVWEWTSTIYMDYPYSATDGRENQNDDARRVLRGSSWNDYQYVAWAAFRGPNDPYHRSYSLGFRVVCASPI